MAFHDPDARRAGLSQGIGMYKTNKFLRSRLLREGVPGEPTPGGGGATPPATDGLGDAGKAAIQREREAAQEAGRLKAAAEARATQLQQELDALKGATQTEQEKAIAAARTEAAAEVFGRIGQNLVAAAIETAATGAKFHDPADAAALLSARYSEVTVSDNGAVDRAKVAELVKELAESKPHLVQSGAPVPQRLPGQGTPPAAPKTGSVAAGAELYRQLHQKT
jgi:hypothetical protein